MKQKTLTVVIMAYHLSVMITVIITNTHTFEIISDNDKSGQLYTGI